MNISPLPVFPACRLSTKNAPITEPLYSLTKKIAGSEYLALFRKVVNDEPSLLVE